MEFLKIPTEVFEKQKKEVQEKPKNVEDIPLPEFWEMKIDPLSGQRFLSFSPPLSRKKKKKKKKKKEKEKKKN